MNVKLFKPTVMKKTLLTALIALAAIVAMPVAANAQTETAKGSTEQTNKSKKERRVRPERKNADAFEGITLTDAQKEALKALKPECPKAQVKSAGGNKEVADSCVHRQNPAKVRADYVNGVKKILTPEQYVVFLENVVINNAPIPGGRHQMRPETHNLRQKDMKQRRDQKGKDRKGSPQRKVSRK